MFDNADIAAVLDIDASDIDGEYPVQAVSTGLPFIIVPLKTLAAVKKAKANTDKLLSLGDGQHTPKVIFVFFTTSCPSSILTCLPGY